MLTFACELYDNSWSGIILSTYSLQQEIQNVMTHNRTTQQLKR
jgi:hypothetical protein